MGWRAVRGVLVSGSGGLLCPRLITGMCGGRGEYEEDTGRDAADTVGGTGSRGGGEERAGDLSAEAGVGAGPPLRFSSSSSMSMEAGAASVPARGVSDSAGGVEDRRLSSAPLSHCELVSGDAFLWGGLRCSMEARSGDDGSEEEEERRGRSKGEAGATVGSSFSIMVESHW